MYRKTGSQRHRPDLWRRIKTLRTVRQMHAKIIVSGNHVSFLKEVIFSAAISIPNALCYADKVFDTIPHRTRDLFMYNTMIRASSQGPKPSHAISYFVTMIKAENPIAPDQHTFPFLLKSCSRMSASSTGHQVHARIIKEGMGFDGFVRNALINFNANCGDLENANRLFDGSARDDPVAWSAMIAGYARRGLIRTARKLFEEAPYKDMVSWNVMITAYAKLGLMTSARELFDRIPNKDIVSFNTVISGYAKICLYDKATQLFEEMKLVGMRPDKVTLLTMLSICANSGTLEAGEKLRLLVLETCLEEGSLNLFHGNALIDMYAKLGCIGKSLEIFKSMKERDVTTWNTVINGLAIHGHTEKCIAVFTEMLTSTILPDEITFVGVLSACSHGGMVDKGRRYFHIMTKDYNVNPNIKHYGCMVDMLGRAGQLKEAFEFIGTMNVAPNSVVWRALLGACHLHGNAELGRIANQQLVKLGNEGSGDFILLSNIYSSVGEWAGAQNMRRLMDGKGVPKEVGCSSLVGDA